MQITSVGSVIERVNPLLYKSIISPEKMDGIIFTPHFWQNFCCFAKNYKKHENFFCF